MPTNKGIFQAIYDSLLNILIHFCHNKQIIIQSHVDTKFVLFKWFRNKKFLIYFRTFAVNFGRKSSPSTYFDKCISDFRKKKKNYWIICTLFLKFNFLTLSSTRIWLVALRIIYWIVNLPDNRLNPNCRHTPNRVKRKYE